MPASIHDSARGRSAALRLLAGSSTLPACRPLASHGPSGIRQASPLLLAFRNDPVPTVHLCVMSDRLQMMSAAMQSAYASKSPHTNLHWHVISSVGPENVRGPGRRHLPPPPRRTARPARSRQRSPRSRQAPAPSPSPRPRRSRRTSFFVVCRCVC